MSQIPKKHAPKLVAFVKRGGKFGFTIWAGPEQNPGAKIVNDAIEAHANLNVVLPEGPRNICPVNERNAGRY
jgi:hypothetical protein